MFDRCRRWRELLSRRADGALPVAQWGALEDHLARCPRCRANAEADHILGHYLQQHTGMLDTTSARRFDNRVLAALRQPSVAPAKSPFLSALAEIGVRWRETSFGFLSQIAGGALVAACVTALCLLSALHSTGFPAGNKEKALQHALIAPERNELPVPLESLLRSPSPRAALLWTAPSAPKTNPKQPLTPPSSPLLKPVAPRRAVVPASLHGSRPIETIMS